MEGGVARSRGAAGAGGDGESAYLAALVAAAMRRCVRRRVLSVAAASSNDVSGRERLPRRRLMASRSVLRLPVRCDDYPHRRSTAYSGFSITIRQVFVRFTPV